MGVENLNPAEMEALRGFLDMRGSGLMPAEVIDVETEPLGRTNIMAGERTEEVVAANRPVPPPSPATVSVNVESFDNFVLIDSKRLRIKGYDIILTDDELDGIVKVALTALERHLQDQLNELKQKWGQSGEVAQEQESVAE